MLEVFGASGLDAMNSGQFEPATGNPRLDTSKLRYMLERGINVVATTGVGRLFDAVACLGGVARVNKFEGQAAMLLESEIGRLRTEGAYPLPGGDWVPLDQGSCSG